MTTQSLLSVSRFCAKKNGFGKILNIESQFATDFEGTFWLHSVRSGTADGFRLERVPSQVSVLAGVSLAGKEPFLEANGWVVILFHSIQSASYAYQRCE